VEGDCISQSPTTHGFPSPLLNVLDRQYNAFEDWTGEHSMAEYDIAFATKLAAVADEVDEKDPWAYDARRVTVYLSRLSAEITLKALLEKAGVPVPRIRDRSHDLRGLLKDLGGCEVQVEIAPGVYEWCSASRGIRTAVIDLGMVRLPIGEIIDAEDQGASKYPDQIRYGEAVIDFNPGLVASMAIVLAEWAKFHWNTIRWQQK
jgi:hypothetical protein